MFYIKLTAKASSEQNFFLLTGGDMRNGDDPQIILEAFLRAKKCICLIVLFKKRTF